jgi:hypothetical protein
MDCGWKQFGENIQIAKSPEQKYQNEYTSNIYIYILYIYYIYILSTFYDIKAKCTNIHDLIPGTKCHL